MKLDLVKIRWIDSACSNSWWTLESETEEIEKIKPIGITSVGYIIKESDVFISLAQNYGENPEQFCNVITIPKGCVIETVVLEKHF